MGDLRVSRSRECDLLSVLLIYHRIFFCIFIVYCRIVFCYMLLSVGCFGLVVILASLFPFGRIYFVVLVMRKKEGRTVEVAPDI